jgi:hypothetical protein
LPREGNYVVQLTVGEILSIDLARVKGITWIACGGRFEEVRFMTRVKAYDSYDRCLFRLEAAFN